MKADCLAYLNVTSIKRYKILPNPKPNPRGNSLIFGSLLITYMQIVRLEPSNNIGPIAEAPRIEPIPESNKKSPEPIPSCDRSIL